MRRTLTSLLPTLCTACPTLFVIALALVTVANAWKGR
jgi:hypothetical protein